MADILGTSGSDTWTSSLSFGTTGHETSQKTNGAGARFTTTHSDAEWVCDGRKGEALAAAKRLLTLHGFVGTEALADMASEGRLAGGAGRAEDRATPPACPRKVPSGSGRGHEVNHGANHEIHRKDEVIAPAVAKPDITFLTAGRLARVDRR